MYKKQEHFVIGKHDIEHVRDYGGCPKCGCRGDAEIHNRCLWACCHEHRTRWAVYDELDPQDLYHFGVSVHPGDIREHNDAESAIVADYEVVEPWVPPTPAHVRLRVSFGRLWRRARDRFFPAKHPF